MKAARSSASGHGLLRDLRKNKIPGDLPPSPQVWGNRAIQSPPDLGDLGGGLRHYFIAIP